MLVYIYIYDAREIKKDITQREFAKKWRMSAKPKECNIGSQGKGRGCGGKSPLRALMEGESKRLMVVFDHSVAPMVAC